MHRNIVTYELHGSYFRSMTIKYAILKTAEMTHSDGQLWGDTEWAIELLYNSVKTGSQLVWGPDPLVTRCGRESQHPAEWAPGPPVEQPWRQERHNADGHKSGGEYIAVLFGLQLPLTHKPFQIKWEVYFFKEVFARLYSLRQYAFCLYMYIYIYAYLLGGYTTSWCAIKQMN